MLDLGSDFGARAERRLRGDLVAWLATVRPDGVPVPVPVWFLWDGSTVVLYSQPRRGKIRNLEHSPRASLHLNSDERGDDVVVLVGDARADSSLPPAHEIPAYLEKYREEIARLGADPASFAADYSVGIRFTPERISGF